MELARAERREQDCVCTAHARAEETESALAERREQVCLRVTEHRCLECAQELEEDHRRFYLDMSTDEFVKQLQENEDKEKLFGNTQHNLAEAVLLWHMNAGCMRFDQHKEHEERFDGEDIDIEKTQQKIEDEELSPEEFGFLIEHCFCHHSFADGKTHQLRCLWNP